MLSVGLCLSARLPAGLLVFLGFVSFWNFADKIKSLIVGGQYGILFEGKVKCMNRRSVKIMRRKAGGTAGKNAEKYSVISRQGGFVRWESRKITG